MILWAMSSFLAHFFSIFTRSSVGYKKNINFFNYSSSIKDFKLTHENFMEELPVIIKNSHLLNSVLCELQEMSPSPKKYTFLDLSTSNVLEKNLRSLIENVDELGSETNKFLNHHKQLQKQNHLKQQYLQKRVRFFKFLSFKQI